MKDRKIFLYYFLSMAMVLFPMLNMLSFVPMVILYKKSDLKTYFISSGLFVAVSLVILGNFTSLIPVLISFVIIKGMDNSKDGYKVLLGSAFVMTVLLVSDFLIIKLDAKSYGTLLNTMNEVLNGLEGYKEVLNIKDAKELVSQMLNVYPAISFGLSYAFCTLGYTFVTKRIYGFNRNSDDIILPFDFKFFVFSIIVIALMVISSGNKGENFYKISLICYNLILIFIEIMLVQGFAKFNVFLKKHLGKIVANIISIVSIFFIIIYLIYFVLGIYSSVMRGSKWKRN
ncbi:DUF2232 domain-containing protein [uncultured Parvimonas sp.]|uniref:DUF2232 domain-containing protein n=1 Tax=uncultured Parvimonas sp. TaxID=747372 RepID=UPI00280469C0|nr:DUF2232 domain-containing protein [uncultured Parvimonas sp.]